MKCLLRLIRETIRKFSIEYVITEIEKEKEQTNAMNVIEP